jgi:hypothetical protein
MFPSEVLYQIFEEALLLRDKSVNDNILLTSRTFNAILTKMMRDEFERRFKMRINVERSIYRSIVDALIIYNMLLDDRKKLNDKCKDGEERMKNEREIEKSSVDVILFLEKFYLHRKFVIRLDYLDYGKRMYRKMLVKDHEMSATDLVNGAFHSAIKFRKFHQKNKYMFGCDYRPYSVRKIKRKV